MFDIASQSSDNSKRNSKQKFAKFIIIIAGVPGEKPQVTSDKLPDSPSKFPCIHL